MADSQEAVIDAILRSELGRTARFWRYGRENRTPMTFVLDEVERQIRAPFLVYWVDGGPPEVFMLPGLSPTPVVFSTRYLSLSAFIRQLLAESALENVLIDAAERSTLKVMAEMALRYGDPDYAVLAFVKSVTGKGVWLDDGDRVMQLEHEPIGEAYMATWFYGLVHELGHLLPDQVQAFPQSPIVSDAGIVEAITVALDHFSSYPDSLKAEAISRAKQLRSESVLGIDHLRREGVADIFAASVLFQTTIDIMKEIHERDSSQPQFSIEQFIQEMIIFLNIVTIIDRCRRVASVASATTTDREALFESLTLQPVSVFVRFLMVRVYLRSAIAGLVFRTREPTAERVEQVTRLIDEINEHYASRIQTVDSGIARAMEFSLYHERRDNDWILLDAFRGELPNSSLARIEAQHFIEMAESLGKESKLLRALKRIVADPTLPVQPDPTGDLAYLVPWIEGPNGFSRPFGVDTRHGHLIFVFHQAGELLDAFFKPSEEMLKPGFQLKTALVAVPRKERLAAELAANMPSGQKFRVIVEGTDEFVQYMTELGEDAIW